MRNTPHIEKVIDVIEVSRNEPDWVEYLSRHSNISTIYLDPRWGQVLQEACGAQPYYLSAYRGGNLVGVLTLLGQRSLLFGNRLCSLPYFDASGALADDIHANNFLVCAAKKLLETEKYASLEIRQFSPGQDDIPTRTDKVTLWLKLPTSSDALWRQLKTKVRTKIRKVRKNGFDLLVGGNELLGDFHNIYSRTMRDLGSPSHGRRLFESSLEAFNQEARIFVVRNKERALAAAFTFQDSWGLHVPWSGSDFRHRELGANRYLYWEMLLYAADAGAKNFDFGRSTVDSGTYEFKREWGAEPIRLYWQYFLSVGNDVPNLRPDSRKYKMMVKCWRKLPLPVTQSIGPWIVNQLS